MDSLLFSTSSVFHRDARMAARDGAESLLHVVDGDDLSGATPALRDRGGLLAEVHAAIVPT
jgi:hypothetical protein